MKLRKIIAALTLIGCATAPVSSFAKALPGEVEKIIPYVLYGEKTTGNVRIVLPEKYKDYEPVPYASKYEDNYSQWNVYKPVTLDGVFYRWAKIDNFTEEEEKENRYKNVWFEYVLVPDGNPYTQAELPEIEQVPAAQGAKFNSYYRLGKNASDMRIYTKGKVRSFKNSYYPKLQLEGLTGRGRGEGFDKIPMVGIKEFVESTDNLSLVWNSGTARVTNSTNGEVTDFCIYNRGGTKKATLINNRSYASLTDLLIAEYGSQEFAKFKYYDSQNYGQDIIYLYFGDSVITGNEYMKIFKNTISHLGILNGFAETRGFGGSYRLDHSADADVRGIGSGLSTELTAIEELEKCIEPSGCIYKNPKAKFSNQYNDLEAWKVKMREAVKDKKTDKEKVQTLVTLLTSSLERPSYVAYGSKQDAAEKAISKGKYYGHGSDLQNLFLFACTENNIPSVKMMSSAGGERNISCNYIVAAHYDGHWNYFNIENAEELSKSYFVASREIGKQNNMSYYITVSKYAGLSNMSYFSNDEGYEYNHTWYKRYDAMGYKGYR